MKTKTTKAKALPRKRKLTRKQMAVAIAKDVISQIKAKRYIAEGGTYIEGLGLSSEVGQLQPHLKKKSLRCHVCALGSVFLSSVRKFNDFDLSEWGWEGESDAMRLKLSEFFTKQEIRAIEGEFEHWRDQVLNLWELPSDSDKMIFIMQEIIRQKGKFNPRLGIKRAAKFIK